MWYGDMIKPQAVEKLMVSESRQYRKRASDRDYRSTLQDGAGTGAGAPLVRGSGKYDKRDRRRLL